MLKYLRYSNIKICVDLNPFTWSFKYASQVDVSFAIRYLRIGPFTITAVLDNGSEYILMGLTSDMKNSINKEDEVASKRYAS